MKKTKLMRAALLLLVLTLITSCFVGGTFAKYVTKGDSTDIARVAKWGVTVDAKGATFAEEYATDDQSVAGAIAKSVVSTDKGKNVVAPGTAGTMAKITLTGTPEVAVNVSYKGAFTTADWTIKVNDTDTYYCPLEITVGKTTIKGTAYTNNQTGFEKAVNDAIAGCSKNYVANTNLANQGADSLDISWKWAFEGNDDVKDTALGNLTTAPTVTLAITTTVTQVD